MSLLAHCCLSNKFFKYSQEPVITYTSLRPSMPGGVTSSWNSNYLGRKGSEEGCRKTSVFLSRETGISGNFVGRIKGAKCPFDLQFLTWDFS